MLAARTARLIQRNGVLVEAAMEATRGESLDRTRMYERILGVAKELQAWSCVPKTDDQGRILRHDGQIWHEGDGDDAIDWVSNEGVRICVILKHLAKLTLDDAHLALLAEMGPEAGLQDRTAVRTAVTGTVSPPAPSVDGLPVESAVRTDVGLAASPGAFGGSRHVVFLHGRAQQGHDPEQLRRYWTAGLNGGLTRAGLATIAPADVWFPFYAQQLVQAMRTRGEALPRSPREMVDDPVDAAAPGSGATRQLYEQMIIEAADLAGMPAERLVRREGLGDAVHQGLSWLANTTNLDRLLIAATFADVAAYLDDQRIRESVLDCVLQTMPQTGQLVLLSHSLGTVVAVDLLTRLDPRVEVELLLTAGSPLGMDSVYQRLLTGGAQRPRRQPPKPGPRHRGVSRSPRGHPCDRDSAHVTGPDHHAFDEWRDEVMATLKVATVNGEWMNDWFTLDAQSAAFKPTFSRDGEQGVTAEAAGRLGRLISDIDADIVALVEAPSRAAELALFIDDYLTVDGSATYDFVLGDSGGSQKLALLFKPDRAAVTLTPSTDAAPFIEPWLADVDGDAVLDEYAFTRNPLCCTADVSGTRLEVVVAHLKSNFINQGRALWQDPARRPDFIRASLRNRRRIATEAMRIRGAMERRLDADPASAFIVLGDLNDGPGQDYFEELYLAHNVTDILVGSPYRPERLFGHAQADVAEGKRYSAVFDDFVTNEPHRHMLLDHILLSPALTNGGAGGASLTKVPGSGRIEHDAWGAQISGDGSARDHRATDHRPASVTLTHP
ncbi:endonuclease/exonuclease/phosphatase family protein [Nonomuraea sp. NPDC049158]|uniref:endonuclease/exonuclease/phosphatase family protein n=1 Tax=Nonomuraea sp. NPDC049158 TaxID=3155649 RepID=UPI0034089929